MSVKTIHLNPNRAMDFGHRTSMETSILERTAERILDPLANSELARLEDELTKLRVVCAEITTLKQTVMSYQEATHKLAQELCALHKVFANIGEADAYSVAMLAASIFGVSAKEMMSSKRPAHLTLPRFAAMYVMRTKMGMNLSAIGKFFKRDHGTAMHGISKAEKLLKEDSQFKERVGKMIEALASKQEVVKSEIPASLIGATFVNLPLQKPIKE